MSVYRVSKETVPGRIYGASGTATTVESAIDSPFPIQKSVLIKADGNNTADIIVGNRGNAANGYRLGPDDTITLPIDSLAAVGIVSAGGSQTYYTLQL